MILSFQMLVTTVFVAFSVVNPKVLMFQVRNMYIFWIMFFCAFLAEITLLCCRSVARQVPINYILLLVVTVGQSYMLSLISSEYTPDSVLRVFLMTLAGFCGMTAYALTTKYDISIMYGVAAGAAVCMLTFGIILIFTRSSVLYLVYSALAVICALVFVAIDTQMIIKDRKYGIGCDDFIVAALILYLDILQIFIHLLRLFGTRRE